jgi:hypothetical protein
MDLFFVMAPGAESTCPCFTLDNKDDGGAVASPSAALSGMTIMPSLSAADASWGVVGLREDVRLRLPPRAHLVRAGVCLTCRL